MRIPPVTLLIIYGVTHGYPLSMVLYGITLFSLMEELRAEDPGLITPFKWTTRNLTGRHVEVPR